MRNSLETRLGFFFALALIAAVIILEMIGGFDFFKKSYPLYARFANVQELKKGDPVKMAGVQVGKVESIRLTNDVVLVEMLMDEGVAVRTDSKATIRFTGLLGQNFVSIDFGQAGSPQASAGAYLETEEQPDLGSLMLKLEGVATGVENLTKSFTGENISELLGPLTDFLKQNSTNLNETIDNMRAITQNVREGKGTVGKLLYDEELYNTALTTVTNLQNTFQTTADDIRSLVASAKTTVETANKTLEGINAGEGTVGKLLKEETLYNETTTAMTNLREILEKINRGQGTIGKIINDEELYRNVRVTLQKVERATESLEDQGPLSILGLAIGSLF